MNGSFGMGTGAPMYGAAPMGYNQYTGAQPQQMVTRPNVLTAEEIESLQKKGAEFSITISNEERMRSICNHRSADGSQDTLVEDPATGQFVCQICGYKFNALDPNTSYEDIRDAINKVEDIMQTTKMLYVDFPQDAAREYWQTIALLEKLPQLFQFAAKNFMKHESNTWNFRNGNMNSFQMYQNLMNAFGGGMMAGYNPSMSAPMGGGMPMGTNPMYGSTPSMGAPMGAPMGGANPVFTGVSNGFGQVGAAPVMPGYTPDPNVAGYQFTPNPATTPAEPTITPVAPVAEPTETVTAKVKA